jgi:hypothetical protein
MPMPTESLLSHIHVDNANLLDITRTLVATGVIVGRLECIRICSNGVLHVLGKPEMGYCNSRLIQGSGDF